MGIAIEKYEGSVSHATLRNEDLIPTFLQTLDSIIEDLRVGTDEDKILAEQVAEEIAEIEADLESKPDYFKSEGADHDLQTLMMELDTLAPDGYYFGAHPGDGADIGFWPVEDEG